VTGRASSQLKNVLVMPKGSLPEQVQEENWDGIGKLWFTWKMKQL